jgi:hypothetical protein
LCPPTLARPASGASRGRQHPHGGRLAGSVGAQQRHDAADLDLEVEVLDGHKLAETLRQSLGLNRSICHKG